MKIGINLVGVSYNDGNGRYRNYKDALDGFINYIVNPFLSDGHQIKFYIYSYENPKINEILESYKPVEKYYFTNPLTEAYILLFFS